MKRQYLFLFLLIFSPSLLWGSDDKELRQLHHMAESAMNRSDFASAKEAYEQLLNKITTPSVSSRKYRVDWPTYVDIISRLALTQLHLKEYAEGERLLQRLIAHHPPIEFLPSIKILLSRFQCSQGFPGKAYLLLKDASESLSPTAWKGEDRSFFHSIEYTLNSHYENLLNKAKRYFTAYCYAEAKKMYEEVLEAIESGFYPKVSSNDSLVKKKIRFRLAEINFYLANYDQTLSLLDLSEEQTRDKVDQQMLYLAALTYQAKQAYEKALDCFETYLKSGKREELEHYEHALFEMGLSFYRKGNIPLAKRYFEALQHPHVKQEKPTFLGAIYLSRIFLKEKEHKKADRILSTLAERLPKGDPLHYEIAFIRGIAAFEKEEYAVAVDLFMHSFPPPPFSGEWCHEALFYLGWCHLKLGDDLLKGKRAKEHFFSKAERIFHRLLKTKEHEKSCLALGKLYLLQRDHFALTSGLLKLENLLVKEAPFFSQEGKIQALLLRAEGKIGYAEKEGLYSEATHEDFKETSSYADGWYYRGLNHFQEGLKQKEEAAPFFEKAIHSFEHAFLLVEKKDPKKAVQLLKWEAQANFYRDSPDIALEVFSRLLNTCSISSKEKAEILYLKGLVASRDPDPASQKLAEDSLHSVLSLYPHTDYAADAIYVLGTLCFQKKEFHQAKEYFFQLANQYPQSRWAGEGLFWAAESSEKLGEIGASYFRQAFQNYPSSLHADEAYFRLFPLESYVDGKKEALLHLSEFSSLFPHSPLHIVSSYLLGIHSSSFDEAKRYFEKGIYFFEEKNVKALPFPLIYFYYRTRLELALLCMQSRQSTEKECFFPLLQQIVNDFETPNHPFASLLKEKNPYPSLYEESEFALAQAYLMDQKRKEAQEVFSQMLSHYAEAGIREGYYLARLWQEQGNLALYYNDAETALRCFAVAEECGKGFLSDEQKLTLWISESECYRRQKAYGLAMRTLSKVINEDVASPIRIKAMLLRAEIYELQGRQELAIRQLEATAKKGGEWALQAKEKLKVNYGIE